MSPYRMMEIKPPEPKKKSRPFYKTLYLKLLILVKGKWKERFVRCRHSNCLFFTKRADGINGAMIFHNMKHYMNFKGQDTAR